MNRAVALMNQPTQTQVIWRRSEATGLRNRCLATRLRRKLLSSTAVRVASLRALSALFVTSATMLLAVVFFSIEPADAATCTGSLQDRVDAASPGDTVIADPCIYREQIVIDKPLTLVGQPGSEIRGSDVWKRWSKVSGDLWRSRRTIPTFLQDEPNVYCMPNTVRCKLPEQIFFDGKPLYQVKSLPKKANQFFVDSKRRVILKRIPRDHMVEVTTRQHWVLGTPSADAVTIKGWTMKHAGTESRSAALMNRLEVHETGGERWTVRSNVLSDGHSAIISLTNSPSHKILGNHILRGGMLGIKGAGRGSVIRSNEIAYNNTERYCYDAECGIGATGGAKFASNVADTIFDHNVVHDNFGKGVHYDIDCSNNTLSNNRVYDNARIGLSMELCYSGEVFGNVVYGNGYETPTGSRGTGIQINSCENTEIYDNIVAYNQGGINVVSSGTRLDHELTHDVFVHDNTIISQSGVAALTWRGPVGVFAPSANNLGADNRYYYPVAENGLLRFAWAGAITRLSDFNATPGEERGRYLTVVEKDAILAQWKIPTGARR